MLCTLAVQFTSCIAGEKTTYYVSNNGKEENTGLSPTSPWPFSKVQHLNYYPRGSSFLFKRGEKFIGTVRVSVNRYDKLTTVADTAVFGAYGAGPKPIITTRDTLPGWSQARNWHFTSIPNVWAIKRSIGSYTPRIWLNNIEYARAKDSLQVNAAKRTAYLNGDFQWIYVYATRNPALFYKKIESSSTSNSTIDLDGLSYVRVRDLDIRGSEGACIDLAFNDDVIIERCKIGSESVRAGIRFNHANNVIVRNNLFDSNDTLLNDFYLSREGGDGVAIARASRNIQVHNNIFLNWRHTAIELVNELDQDSIKNIHIHHNLVSAPDINYGRGFDILYNNGANIIVEYNTFENLPTQNQMAANGLIFRHNIINNIRNSINYDYGIGTGIWIAGFSGYKPQNMTIEKNTITNCDGPGIDIDGAFGEGKADGTFQKVKNNTIANNAFTNNGKNVKNPAYGILFYPAVDIMIRKDPDVQSNTFKSNSFSEGSRIYYRGAIKTIASFNSVTTEGDKIEHNSITTKSTDRK